MESISEVIEICKQYNIKNYTINDDLSIDVNENVSINHRGLKEIPLVFNNVNGFFDCSYNHLTTLVGSPKTTLSHFICNDNFLTNLKGSPDHVGGSFYSAKNKLTSLENCPVVVLNNFYCVNNCLTDLIGSPEHILGSFDCSSNEITDLIGSPKRIDFSFNCSRNKLTDLKNSPEYVGLWFGCSYNQLIDNYCDTEIGDYFYTTLKQKGMDIDDYDRCLNYSEWRKMIKRKNILNEIFR